MKTTSQSIKEKHKIKFITCFVVVDGEVRVTSSFHRLGGGPPGACSSDFYVIFHGKARSEYSSRHGVLNRYELVCTYR